MSDILHGGYCYQATDEFQKTISNQINIKGRAGFVDKDVEIILLPEKPNVGILFDIAGSGEIIPASVKHLGRLDNFNTTCLIAGQTRILTIEHLLAAIFGLGIDNIRIIVQEDGLIPFLDGSSYDYCDAIMNSGVIEQKTAKKKIIICRKRDEVIIGERSIKIEPSYDHSLLIHATIEYPNPIGIQTIEYKHSRDAFCLKLAWARTFAFNPFVNKRKTIKRFPGFKIKRIPFIETNMIIYTRNRYLTHIRKADEPIRHKVLDYFADMALLGSNLVGNIKLHKPGHNINHLFLQKVWENIENKEIASGH